MPKYLCMQRSQTDKREKPSPAKMEAMYAVFSAWREKYQANIVDMGGALKGGGKIVTSEGATDGPFVEARPSLQHHALDASSRLPSRRRRPDTLPGRV